MELLHQRGFNISFICDGKAVPPNGARPRGISQFARNHVDMKLRHQIAQRSDIDLHRACDGFEAEACAVDLLDQHHPFGVLQVVDFGQPGPARDKDEPGVTRVVHQQDARQCPIRDMGGVCGKTLMQLKRIHRHSSFVGIITRARALRGIRLRIGIIGCGIAGQAAAIALARDGHDVTVFERFAEAKPVGAGLLLQPSGQLALERLGILDRVKQWGAPVKRLYGRTTGGRTIMDLRYVKFDKQAQGLGLHRAVLFQALQDGLAASGAKLVLGFDVTKIKDVNAPRVIARDGRAEGPFDLVVNCAGTHDNLRKSLNVRVDDPVYPWGCLWAILPDRTGAFQEELRQVCESTQIMIGILPIGRVPDGAHDGNHVALFWSLLHKQYGAQRKIGIDALRSRILHYWPEAKPVVDQLHDINQFSLATYRDVRMKTWREGHVLVIGDAAHGTSPQLGQGANLALIDAITLASALRQKRDVESALITYERMRRPHLRYYQWASHRVTPMFQSNSRVLGWLRDIFFGPMAKTPGIARIMRNTLAGVRKSPMGLWKAPD